MKTYKISSLGDAPTPYRQLRRRDDWRRRQSSFVPILFAFCTPLHPPMERVEREIRIALDTYAFRASNHPALAVEINVVQTRADRLRTEYAWISDVIARLTGCTVTTRIAHAAMPGEVAISVTDGKPARKTKAAKPARLDTPRRKPGPKPKTQAPL